MDSLSITPSETIFLELKNINSPLDKKYKILQYSQQIIKNENNIFDLIYYKGNKKKFNYVKNIYTTERSKIKKQILTQSQKDIIFKSSNIINIKSFDLDKINVHSNASLFEGIFISGLLRHLENKKINQAKILEYKKKNKFVFKRPSLSLKKDLALNKFFLKNKKNFTSEENKVLSNNNSSIDNNREKLNSETKIDFSSVKDLFDNDSMDVNTKNEFRKTMNSIFCRPYHTLNKDKKNFSSVNFFDIQSKKLKMNGIKDQKMNLKHKKLSKLLFSKVFKEENKIVNNLNEINHNLIDFKHTKNFNSNDSKIVNIERNFLTPRNNKYKNINEVLTSFHKSLYRFPVINKFIYGSKNPKIIFSKSKITSKIDSNLSK